MTEEKPYARFYDQGHTAGLAGVPVEQCPYRPIGTGAARIEQLSRRAAWLEGHADGTSRRHQVIESGRVRDKRRRPELPKAERGRLVRSTILRRNQRRTMLANGEPERYVDRRLRQIAAEREQQVTVSTKRS